jgi:serine protease inhibitor
VLMAAGSAMPVMVDFTPSFRADHGFVFLIRDNSTGTVLFMGRLANPLK